MYSISPTCPGLKCVVPSDAYTAKGLLAAAIRDDDPVIVLQPPRSGAARSCDVPEEPYTVPIGQARIVRPGRDVTLVGIGAHDQRVRPGGRAAGRARASTPR